VTQRSVPELRSSGVSGAPVAASARSTTWSSSRPRGSWRMSASC